jgi:hypothetical protein
LCAICPAFEAVWAEEGAPPEDGLVEGVHYKWSHHSIMSDFLEFFAKNHAAFTGKQLQAVGKWINDAVLAGGDLENAISTCFLEHATQVRINRILQPYLSPEAKRRRRP